MSRVLLADDNAIAQRLGERILKDEGYEVVSVTDGSVVMRRLEEAQPQLLVADAFLPNLSGIALATAVRSMPQHRHIGILLTGSPVEPITEEVALAAGADGILIKPFAYGILGPKLKALAKLVAARQAGEAAWQPYKAAQTKQQADGSAAIVDDGIPAAGHSATGHPPAGHSAAGAENALPEPGPVEGTTAYDPAANPTTAEDATVETPEVVSAELAAAGAIDAEKPIEAEELAVTAGAPAPLEPAGANEEEAVGAAFQEKAADSVGAQLVVARPTVSEEQISAAVALALDEAIPQLVASITARVKLALGEPAGPPTDSNVQGDSDGR